MTETADTVPKHEGDQLPAALEAFEDKTPASLLLGYQQRALEVAKNFLLVSLLVIEKSRRIGLTWALAAYAVLRASASRIAKGSDVLYISYSQEMTREFIDACAMWAKAFAGAAVEVGDYMFDDTDPEKPTETRQIKAFRITFASRFEIVALSSAPRSLRGKQGVTIIDEAAFVDNLAELLKAALALTMWGGQVIVVSTHNGVDNPFNELLEEIKAKRREGVTEKITLDDALADGLYERICLVTGREATPSGKIEWERKVRSQYGDDADEELDCLPKAGAGCYLDAGKIAACVHTEAGDPTKYAGGLAVVGRDVAIRRDLSVIHACEIVGPMLWLRERWLGRKATFLQQTTEFDRIMKFYRVLRAAIDQTGMGEKVVEDAILQYGERVIGLLMTPPNRLDIAQSLKKRFDEETIRIPDDPALKTDLRAIKKTKGTGGAPRLVETNDTVHADEFWALALACWLADMGIDVYDFLSAGGQRGANMGDGDNTETNLNVGFGVVAGPNEMEGFDG